MSVPFQPGDRVRVVDWESLWWDCEAEVIDTDAQGYVHVLFFHKWPETYMPYDLLAIEADCRCSEESP